VYTFAGMDPKTGKSTDTGPTAQAVEAAVPQVQPKQAIVSAPQETLQQAQDRLNKSVEEGEMTKADANVEKMKLGLRPSFGRANQNANTNMQAQAIPITASTTKWDPEDAMARGAR
jgi:transcription initiation factor TFIID subunit TAF12